MATRSLTEVFILMRNNALQSRHIFSEQVSRQPVSPSVTENLLTNTSTPATPEASSDDRMALVNSRDDPEMGIAMGAKHNRLPPEWVDGVEEVQFEVSRLKTKMKELSLLHDKHLNRPTLDDSMDEEHAIDIQTQEITQMFHRCQRTVQQINNKSRMGSNQEQKLNSNIVSSLARTLQELSSNFRKSQSSYLRKLQMREERSKQYFETEINLGEEYGYDELDDLYDRGFTQQQQFLVEDNTAHMEQREREIAQIVRSIHDLNDIFKDLAAMIVDQGTILDRIDYNIEQTSTRVEKGLQQLQKAEKYQKKNRKMYVIVVLFIIVIILIIIFIATKT